MHAAARIRVSLKQGAWRRVSRGIGSGSLCRALQWGLPRQRLAPAEARAAGSGSWGRGRGVCACVARVDGFHHRALRPAAATQVCGSDTAWHARGRIRVPSRALGGAFPGGAFLLGEAWLANPLSHPLLPQGAAVHVRGHAHPRAPAEPVRPRFQGRGEAGAGPASAAGFCCPDSTQFLWIHSQHVRKLLQLNACSACVVAPNTGRPLYFVHQTHTPPRWTRRTRGWWTGRGACSTSTAASTPATRAAI